MYRLRQKFVTILQTDYGRGYEFVVGALAFASAVLMCVPFAGPMIVAVMFQPKRWRRTVIATALGSALGATVLLWAMHHGIWQLLMHSKPEWTTGSTWSAIDGWLEQYGNWALFVVMALPLPESPALAFLSRHPQNLLPVFAVTFSGKLLKYWVYGYWARRWRKTPNEETDKPEVGS